MRKAGLLEFFQIVGSFIATVEKKRKEKKREQRVTVNQRVMAANM
jgi:hypothetical protein